MANPNPKPHSIPEGTELAESRTDNAGSSTFMATLGRSDHSNSPRKAADTYNLDRFLEQDKYSDGTIYGRMQDQAPHPHPNARMPFYQARATNIMSGFDAALRASKSGN